MEELSLHILDIVENSVAANATKVIIEIILNENFILIKIKDNGIGIDKELLQQIESPFYTSKKERKVKVGLGIPLFKFSAIQSGGSFKIDSKKGEFTEIEATFKLDNIDRPPLGNIYDTILGIIIAHQNVDFEIKIENNGKVYKFSTEKIREIIGEDIPFTYPDIYEFICKDLEEGILQIGLNPKKIY
ncbi:MAG: ATP-binding protein [Exilispira sp.]